MSDTWNFPCYQPMDWGTSDATRNVHGMLWEQGGTAGPPSTTQPYSTAITAIFSFFQRSGWSDETGQPHSIFGVGANGSTHTGLAIYAYGSPLKLRISFWDQVGAAYRYQIDLGDEDGVNWIQADKWYQVGIAANASGITYVVNGTTTPTATVITNNPGALNLDQGTDRLWIHQAQAAWGTNDPATIPSFWPTLAMGPMALSTEVLDFTSSTVRDRIWDSSGDFKNPGEDGSLWFGDTYAANTPEHYLLDGSPRRDNGDWGQVWDAKSGGGSGTVTAPGGLKKQYEAAASVTYAPGMMTYDGSTGYYADSSFTTTGNKVTTVARFNRVSFTGGSIERICNIRGPGGLSRVSILVTSSDHATVGRRNKIDAIATNSSGVIICRLLSSSDLSDGADHCLMFSFDADLGTAILIVDGVDEDDTGNATRVAPTTGTLTGGAGDAYVGAVSSGGQFFTGEIGYFGYRDAYLTNYTDFMTLSVPKRIDEYTWTQWGAQPLAWSDVGKLDTGNMGSSGAFTKFGAITGPA